MVLLPKKWKIYKKAIDLWGVPFQVIMLGEEQAELFKVVSKLARGKDTVVKGNLAEEIADCEIMMEQMAVAFSVPRFWIDDYKKSKINKLERLTKSQENTKGDKI